MSAVTMEKLFLRYSVIKLTTSCKISSHHPSLFAQCLLNGLCQGHSAPCWWMQLKEKDLHLLLSDRCTSSIGVVTSALQSVCVCARLPACLQGTVSHACDISAAQGFASLQGLGLQSVTMPTTPVPVWACSSPTCLKKVGSHVATTPAIKKLSDILSSPQLHPHPSAGQLHSQSQRVQL